MSSECMKVSFVCVLFVILNIHFNYKNFELGEKNFTIRFQFLISGKEDN